LPYTLVIVLLLLVMCAAVAAPPAPPPDDLIAGPASGPWRRLFLDAMVTEQQQGLQRVCHAATPHPANPIIKADQPWEQYATFGGPYLYGTVMWDEGKLRMWYHVHGEGGYLNCHAESTDGVQWTKPSLGLVDFHGSKDNNIYLGITPKDEIEFPDLHHGAGKCHNASVIKRPWEPDPQKRYALFCYGVEYRRPRVAFSPDGLHWTFVRETAQKGLFGSGDVINFTWDPYKRRYFATYKTGDRRGRAAGVAVSADGLNWTKPVETPVFGADDLDPDATQVYGMPVFCYQGLYLGQPWIYNSRWFKYGTYTDQRMYEVEKDSPCTMDVQLAWSWDLIRWTRPPQRASFIPRGKEGAWDDAMIYTARAPVQVGDELYFYYGGWDGPHNATNAKASIGLATLRLDGFCSMQAGKQEGWLISRREAMTKPRVTINAVCRAGGVVVAELLDKDNHVLPGCSREDCVPFKGDAVRHVLTWKATDFAPDQTEGDKKVRFFLKHADLYSYLPE